MPITHILGFPRIGQNRELKEAQESYWKSDISNEELFSVGDEICIENWQRQKEVGLDYITAGDFSFL
ncbi:hypothetical protein [Piscirickettsia litoralis]|uniref:hypothetical protein n=1 Tax=Piscirickettsia litoralis TaxID=1891921 RepID=UPI000A8BE457